MFIFKSFYYFFIFSKNKFIFRKYKKINIKIIKFFNYLYFFSFKFFFLKSCYIYFYKLIFFFNFFFKRIIEFRGKGSKFILKLKNLLIIDNELSCNFFFNLNFLNVNLIKYNLINFLFKELYFMNFFIKKLELLSKKDNYNGKGIFNKTKYNRLKIGKRSQYN